MAMSGLDQRTTAKVILISVVAAVGGFLFGFDTAVINGAVDSIQGAFHLSPALTGFAVSCALLGSALGAWYAGRVADHVGRVRAMIVAAVLFAVSAVGAGLAFSVWSLISWRFIGGIGVGMASVIAPAYIAEVAPSHIRGRLGSLQQLAIVSGIFIALLSDAFLANIAGGASQPLWFGLGAWRWMFLAGLVPALAYAVLAFQIPESPRYLVARGELVRAGEVLREVLGARSREAVQRKVQDIAASLRRDSQRAARLSDLRGPRLGLLPIVWVGILLSIFQQFVGINVIFYYSTTLWHSVGFSESDSLTITVITSVTNVLVTLIAANLYVVSFGATWGPVVWVLLGEMFPNWIRAVALAVAAAAQWLANFAITTTFPVLANAGLSFAYGLYAVFAALSFGFVLKAVKETKGRELEDMTG